MKVRVEKGQFRWKLLNLVFWCFMGLSLPTFPFLLVSLSSFNFFIANYTIFMIAGAIASIFINICIFLQKNWPIGRRVQSALYTTICLIFAAVLVFVPYYFFLLPNHRRYDNAEYTSVYIDRRLTWLTYVGLSSAIAISPVITFASIPGIANSPNLEKFHIFMILLLPSSIISAFFALIVQILVWRQERWSLRNKIINIIVIEVVFVSAGSMLVLATYFTKHIPSVFLLLLFGIFFIPFTGGTLLKHIFINSSLDAVEDKE